MDLAYIEILDTNKELRKELADEIVSNNISNKKLKTLNKELDACYKTISQQDSTILAHEDEIASLKSEIKSLKQRLHKALQDLRYKDNTSTAQDIHILRLEDKVEQLKTRIYEITGLSQKKVSNNKEILDMDHTIQAILDRRFEASASLARIQIHLDNTGVTLPDDIRGQFDRVGTCMANIITYVGLVRRYWQDRNMVVEQSVRRARTLGQQLQEVRTRSQNDNQILTQALNNETDERRVWWLRTQRAERRNHILLQEKVGLRLINRRHKAEADLAEFNRAWVFNRYQKWKAREINSRQIILNLQNNPLINPPNMADARRQPIYNTIATIFAKHEQYTGQESPDEYLDKIWNSISHLEANMTALENANAGDFDNAIKFGLLKSKLGGKYIPVPVNDPYNGGNPINSPATLRAWMRSKYQRETIGSQQVAFQRLTQERFLPSDSPDTYEKRIRPLLLGIPDNNAQVLGFLKSQLSGDLFTWMRIANPGGIDAFFTQLKDLWLERNPSVNTGQIPILPQPELQPVTPTPIPLKDDFKIRLARDLQYTGIATDDATLEQFIYDDLQKKLGSRTAHVRKSPFEPRSVNATKKAVRKVKQKAPVKRFVRLCSVCRKAGHTKINCPGVKRTKKVNHVYHDEVEETEDPEEEYIEGYILEEEEDPEKEEIEEDDDVEYVEYIDDSETRNCNAVKKKWYETEYL